ncbi:MAG: hypothetical protein IK050_05260 [Lachnospiraceae bacterium]|nr:hypothetical protein [Lachnospiraceae bacterium]
MMLKLLELKEIIKRFCDKYRIYLKIVLRFILTFLMLYFINDRIGYNTTFNNMIIMIGISVIGAFAPSPVMVMLVALVTLGQLYSLSLILAIAMLMFYLIIYFMYVRFIPNQVYVVLAIPFLYILKIPYVVPIICGLFFSPVSALSCVFGTLIYYVFEGIIDASVYSDGLNVANTVNFFNMVVDYVKSDMFMVYTMAMFVIVVIMTYIIRKQKIKHSANIAIICAIVFSMITFALATILFNNSGTLLQVLLGVLGSGMIAFVVKFFRMTLDYSGTKNIQFEDDEYYYYVKAVPKLNVTEKDVQVKHIHEQVPTNTMTNITFIRDTEPEEKNSTEDSN